MENIRGKINLKKINWMWKASAVVLIAIIAVIIASRFAAAESVQVSISGMELTDGSWSIGNDNVIWTAKAFDSDRGEYFDLESDATIVWSSSNSNVVDITQSAVGTESTAVLKAVSAGTATVTANFSKVVSTEEGQYEITATASRKVVVKFNVNEMYIPGAPFEDDLTGYSIMTDSCAPVSWKSSDESVVMVSDDGAGNGVLNVIGAGKAAITATNYDGQKISFPVVINARFKESASEIKINNNEYYTLTTNAVHSSNVHFDTSNPKVATVDGDGTIKGVSAGKALMYVYTLDESDPWFELQPNPIRSIPVIVDFSVISPVKSLVVDDTVQLSTNIDSSSASSINWTSSDTTIASVDQTGKIVAHKGGTVTITASVINEAVFGTTNVQRATVEIDVIDSFGLSEREHILNVGEKFDLEALVTDSVATVTWKSSNENVATVSVSKTNKYIVTINAKAKGTSTITATQIINGVTKTATCEVSVKESVLGVSLSPSTLDLTKGSSYSMVVKFTPSKPDNMNLTWISSDEKVVKVDKFGNITAVGGGQAVVYVITEDGVKVASSTISVRVPVTGIKLEVNSVNASLSTGSYQLTYTITPNDEGVNKAVTWTSSATDVATVSQNGLVKFLKPGRATIIVKTVDTGVNGNLIDTCEFYINNPVKEVDLDYTSLTLKIDEQFRLTANITPDDASNKKILWSSSDTSVCKVDENGMITAVGSGSATILAKSEDSGATDMCNVTVYQPVTGLVISNDTMTVRKGREFWLNATALPENAMNKGISWASNDETIAKVDQNGKVITLEAGSCIITATSQDSGVTARCMLTVLQPITGISLNIHDKTLLKGDRFVLVPTITPYDADNKNVKWTTSDSSVASVDENGVVTALKGGVAIIICTTEERGMVASCSVIVHEFVSGIDILQDDMKINVGDNKMLSINVSTDSATNKSVLWSSSNSSIVSVDENGRITAKGVGKATIYVFAKDGSEMQDSIRIEVIKPVKSITVSSSSVSVWEGKSTKVSASISPADATNKDIEWSSSDESVAIVDQSGEIVGMKAGVCKIYAKSTDGNNIIGAIRVTVKATIPATAITINSKSITMLPGQTRKLSARIKPSKSTESVYWVSGDTSVATVGADGTVMAKGQGNTEIYAISNETGVESYCQVIVLALNATYVSLEQYDSYDLDVFGATEKIKWYSNNKRVATVSTNGTIIARMAGTTTITAKVNGKVLYCTVKVSNMRR